MSRPGKGLVDVDHLLELGVVLLDTAIEAGPPERAEVEEIKQSGSGKPEHDWFPAMPLHRYRKPSEAVAWLLLQAVAVEAFDAMWLDSFRTRTRAASKE